MRARHANKKKDRTTESRKWHRAMDLKYIKNDGAMKGLAGQLKELKATNIILT